MRLQQIILFQPRLSIEPWPNGFFTSCYNISLISFLLWIANINIRKDKIYILTVSLITNWFLTNLRSF